MGSDIELAKAIATELGVELELSPMSFEMYWLVFNQEKPILPYLVFLRQMNGARCSIFSTPYYTFKK